MSSPSKEDVVGWVTAILVISLVLALVVLLFAGVAWVVQELV